MAKFLTNFKKVTPVVEALLEMEDTYVGKAKETEISSAEFLTNLGYKGIYQKEKVTK